MRTLLFTLIILTVQAQAEILVVGNAKSGVAAITPQQAEDIFMGRAHGFPNGSPVHPYDQFAPVRAQFYRRLVARSLEQIDAYWARIVFTGQDSPPLQLASDEEVIETVRKKNSAIGYVSKPFSAKDVRVLLVLP